MLFKLKKPAQNKVSIRLKKLACLMNTNNHSLRKLSGGVWYPPLLQQVGVFLRLSSYLMLQQLCCSFDYGKDRVAAGELNLDNIYPQF